MTLYQIIDTLKNIALTQPNVRTATDGDIYEKMNGNPSVRYGVFHVTQTTHTEDEQFDNYGFNLFVIDRLEVDDVNRVSAQSTAKQILSNIIATFCETFDAEHEVITYQPFTQRFKDNTCGVWASVTMQVVKDYSCAEIFGDGAWRPEIVVINNQDITITRNGVYEPSEEYTGFGKVEVALDIPNVKESDTLYLMAGDNGVYKPESPYNAVGEVIYHVEPNQNKTIDVVENGEYVVMPDEGFGGLGAVEVNVDIPIQEKAETFNYNGDYTIVPDENYVAMRRINVKVDYKPKPVIPNGISFTGYEYNNFDEGTFENKDWSEVYDCSGMFEFCRYLMWMDEYPKDVNILGARRMFYFAKLREFPDDWDLSNCLTCREMFEACNFRDGLRPLNLRSCVDTRRMFAQCQDITTVTITNCENLLHAKEMFYGCHDLTEVTITNTQNLIIANSMFYDCNKLTTVNGLSTENVRDMTFMLYNCHKLKSIELDISNCLRLQEIFYYCTDLTEVRFKGNPTKLNNVSNMFQRVNKTGTLYYPAEYADAYQKIIDVLPTTWTAVGE